MSEWRTAKRRYVTSRLHTYIWWGGVDFSHGSLHLLQNEYVLLEERNPSTTEKKNYYLIRFYKKFRTKSASFCRSSHSWNQKLEHNHLKTQKFCVLFVCCMSYVLLPQRTCVPEPYSLKFYETFISSRILKYMYDAGVFAERKVFDNNWWYFA